MEKVHTQQWIGTKLSTFNFEQLNLAYFVQLTHMIPRLLHQKACCWRSSFNFCQAQAQGVCSCAVEDPFDLQ